jgi:hypothetical protein
VSFVRVGFYRCDEPGCTTEWRTTTAYWFDGPARDAGWLVEDKKLGERCPAHNPMFHPSLWEAS